MPAPRPPRAPTAPPAPGLPRVLTRYRSHDSAQLDGASVKPRGQEPQPVPPYVRWSEFRDFLDNHWEAGEHLAVVAMTGSGKTTLIREIIGIRQFVVIIANKKLDDSLYPPMNPQLKELGFQVVKEFNPRDTERPRVVFYCPLTGTDKKDEDRQREQIRTVLRQLYTNPGWCVVIDEVSYLSKDLGLDREMNALWREGRSAGSTVVAGTQRPVNVPRNMWENSIHWIGFRIAGKEDRDTASSYLGDVQGVAFETLARLPKYEFMYVDKAEGYVMRSSVETSRRQQ